MLTPTKNSNDPRISNFNPSPREFQELVDEPIPSTERRIPIKSNSFYSDLHDTATMYYDLWDELSSYAPDFNTVVNKSSQIHSNVQLIKQQYQYFSCESPCNFELKNIFNAFCRNVLCEDTKLSSENSKEATSACSNERNRVENFCSYNELNGAAGKGAHKNIEDDHVLISKIINPLYKGKTGKVQDSTTSSRFNGKEDFREFLTQAKLPQNVFRKKQQVIAISFCPFIFLIVLLLLAFGRNYQSSYDALQSQLAQNSLFFDIQSQVNDAFVSKYNVSNSPFDFVMQDLAQSIDRLKSFPAQKAHSEDSVTFMTSPGIFKTLPLQEATDQLLTEVQDFSKLAQNQVSVQEENYLLWSYNIQNEYYLARQNQTQQVFLDFKAYVSNSPFDATLGIVFFICTLIVLFLSYLRILSLFSLSEDAMHLFLILSQPELNLLKQNCRIFLDCLKQYSTEGTNADEEADLKPIIEEDVRLQTLSPNLDSPGKTRVRALKHYIKSRTSLENRFVGLLGILIVLTFLLFLIPIPFQTEPRNNLNLVLKDLSTLIEFENLFSFSCNSFKQELILERPILKNPNSLQELQIINDKLAQVGKNLALFNQWETVKNIPEYKVLYTNTMDGDICNEIPENKEKCARFENGILTQGFKSTILNKIETITNLTNSFAENPEANLEFLKKFENSNLDEFRRVYLQNVFTQLITKYPQILDNLFQQSSKSMLKYESFVIICWIGLILILYSRVLNPLCQLINERKQLICLIPFKLLISLGKELTDHIETFNHVI